MAKSCCAKPLGKIIKVGAFEAGIIGLDEMLERVSASRLTNEEELKTQLLSLAREYGNYISPSTEELYKEAFLREFRSFSKKQRGG